MLPPRPQNLDKLRELPKLRYIAYEYDYRASRPAHTAAEFWALKDLPSERELVEARDYAGLEAFLRKRISGATERPDSLDWLKLGLAVLAQNEAPRYAAVCREMLAQFGTDASPPDAERCVKLCLATPRSEIEPQVLAPFVEVQRPLANDPSFQTWWEQSRGLYAFRAGDRTAAVEALGRVTSYPNAIAVASAVRAMIFHTEQRPEAAAAELERAREQVRLRRRGWGAWHDDLLADLLIAEAKGLLSGTPSASTK
jgi:hypothetical protein